MSEDARVALEQVRLADERWGAALDASVEAPPDLGFAERTIRLGAGDAFTFDPSTPHSFRAADPDAPTTVMWVLCPALAAADPADPPGGSRAGYAARIKV